MGAVLHSAFTAVGGLSIKPLCASALVFCIYSQLRPVFSPDKPSMCSHHHSHPCIHTPLPSPLRPLLLLHPHHLQGYQITSTVDSISTTSTIWHYHLYYDFHHAPSPIASFNSALPPAHH